ncbi:MAG TPA: undecaprenyl-diphosphatase UppP [Anaerolineae bacterium]|nr:undecaprenyl-diphosphatase UppP [Anaerolineae bacterium]
MTLIQSIILGIIQGATEFIPISSSGHLVLAPYLFGWNIPPEETFVFDVLVQVATLIAVFAYFYNDIIKIISAFIKGIISKHPFTDYESKLGWFIIIATIPAGFVGLFIKKSVENAFNNPHMTSLFLIITGLFLALAEFINKKSLHKNKLSVIDAIWMGIFQIFAIFPGISRSGATITGGMLRKLERPYAARFSFLMSIPVLLAAGILAITDLFKIPNLNDLVGIYFAGFFSAAIVGYISIKWLLSYLSKKPMYIFSLYCIVIGTIVFIKTI